MHFSELGWLQISVPTRKHEVWVTLDAVIEEQIGQIISAVFATLLILTYFRLQVSPLAKRQALPDHAVPAFV